MVARRRHHRVRMSFCFKPALVLRSNRSADADRGRAPQNLHANIMLDIRQREYQSPTPIQAQGIPLVLSGRDVLGCAETGSGKTASFAIPMIQQCINSPPLRRGDGPIGLVLAPTRELAQQVRLSFRNALPTSHLILIIGDTPFAALHRFSSCWVLSNTRMHVTCRSRRRWQHSAGPRAGCRPASWSAAST